MVEDGKVYVFYLKSSPNKVIDVYRGGKEDGTNIQIYDYSYVPQQRFQALKKGNYFIFKDLNSGKVIDVRASEVKNGTNIQIYTQNNTDAQLWKVIDVGGGYYSLQSKLNSGYYLDVQYNGKNNGNNIWLWEGNNSDAQKFKIVKKELYKFRLGVNGLLESKELEKLNITHTAFLIGTDLFEYGTQIQAQIHNLINLKGNHIFNNKLIDFGIEALKAMGVQIDEKQGFERKRGVGRQENMNWEKFGNTLSGTTWIHPDELEEILTKSGKWVNRKYHVFYHNCQDFVSECILICTNNEGMAKKILPVFRPH